MKWRDKLNKSDHQHLKDTDARTLADVKANIQYQDGMTFPCWDCIRIARKLGIPHTLTAFDQRCKEDRDDDNE